jgi:hypothetical protein
MRGIIIGHIIIESVGHPGKAAFLQQAARPNAFRTAAEEALCCFATRLGDRGDATIKISRLCLTRCVIRLWAPKPAMRGSFMSTPCHLRRECGRPLNRATAHQEGCGNGVKIQRIQHAPKAGARAIGKDLFLPHIVPSSKLTATETASRAPFGQRISGHLPP